MPHVKLLAIPDTDFDLLLARFQESRTAVSVMLMDMDHDREQVFEATACRLIEFLNTLEGMIIGDIDTVIVP